MSRWADVPLCAPPTLTVQVQTEPAADTRDVGVQAGFPVMWRPIEAWPASYVAMWTARPSTYLSWAEWEELLSFAGWALELHAVPLLMSWQLRAVLRAWQGDLQSRFQGTGLRWPFSFLVYGLVF